MAAIAGDTARVASRVAARRKAVRPPQSLRPPPPPPPPDWPLEHPSHSLQLSIRERRAAAGAGPVLVHLGSGLAAPGARAPIVSHPN